jgi:hypothetical protein
MDHGDKVRPLELPSRRGRLTHVAPRRLSAILTNLPCSLGLPCRFPSSPPLPFPLWGAAHAPPRLAMCNAPLQKKQSMAAKARAWRDGK